MTRITDELATVAENVRKVTVQVRSSSYGGGSGVIWQSSLHPLQLPRQQGRDKDKLLLPGTEGGSLIITNAHVATNNRATVELWDGRVFEAVRTNIDPTKDLAALKIDATDLPTATIGNSDALRVGEFVLAVGNPFGDSGAVTSGIIHASHQRMVIADIRLFPGNSGGPLADCLGRVIGINTMIVNGLGVAIPSLAVEGFLRGNRQKLGVTVQPVVVDATNKRTLGLLVLSVNSGSAAEAAGMLVGDVLMGVSGQDFTRLDDLSKYLERTDSTKPLPLQILRGGRQLVCQVAEVV
ncbi:peptidase S1 and S6 chymotrypsin/Hap [Scytonema sp. HK-05]|uniref:S1C family serine protease n=1 Tax=Scytonema sp. HK-05 TaxID=1137095 RepID=UPI000AF2A8DD|nr:trypsin-like peptidase domain-containing protein [Scytonema sp. HK-05]BAY48250.1 peptidase S1 and S6 chymotrypsin/Hap [Scytonema sp. HK-05]